MQTGPIIARPPQGLPNARPNAGERHAGDTTTRTFSWSFFARIASAVFEFFKRFTGFRRSGFFNPARTRIAAARVAFGRSHAPATRQFAISRCYVSIFIGPGGQQTEDAPGHGTHPLSFSFQVLRWVRGARVRRV